MSRPAIQNTAHCVGNGPFMTGITRLILIEPFKAAVSWVPGRRASSAGVGATCAGGGRAAAPGAGSEQVLAGRAPSAPGNKGSPRPGSASMKNCFISGESERLCFCRDVTFPVVKPALAANRDLIDG